MTSLTHRFGIAAIAFLLSYRYRRSQRRTIEARCREPSPTRRVRPSPEPA